MWFDPDTEESAGFADMVTDVGFAVMVIAIVTAIAMVARGILPWLV